MSVHEVSTPLSRWLFRPRSCQEKRLRSAYRRFFADVDRYNRSALAGGRCPMTRLHLVPIGVGEAGICKALAARILAEETVRYAVRSPDIRIQVLVTRDPDMAGHVHAACGPVGIDVACPEANGQTRVQGRCSA